MCTCTTHAAHLCLRMCCRAAGRAAGLGVGEQRRGPLRLCASTERGLPAKVRKVGAAHLVRDVVAQGQDVMEA